MMKIPHLLVILINGIKEAKDEEDLFEEYKKTQEIGRKVIKHPPFTESNK